MRIISGYLKGRRFYPPADKWPTRPTTDISKEGLYNILQNQVDFEDTIFLDLFGGTGSHCYEFISRGCTDATYVDRHGPAVQFVRTMAKELDIQPFLKIHQNDIFRFIRDADRSYTLIFAGPPYPMKRIPELPDLILDGNLLAEGGLLVLEHNDDHDFRNHPCFVECRPYGDTRFSFFSKNVR